MPTLSRHLKMLLGTSLCFVSVSAVHAADVEVFGEGTVNEDEVVVEVFADATDVALYSFGVGIDYDPSQLEAVEAGTERAQWYFGDGDDNKPYTGGRILQEEGRVLLIGGRLDTASPQAGVSGERLRLGTVVFATDQSEPPELSLGIARPQETFANFVTTEGGVLDDTSEGVNFGNISFDGGGDPDVDLTFSPESLAAELPAGGSTNKELTIANASGQEADWSIEAPPAWLSVTPAQGSLAGNASTEVSVQFDATDLGAGTFTSALEISSSTVTGEAFEIPVTLVVGGASGAGLEIALSGEDEITLTWDGGGLLQRADEITGPWEDLPNAASPFTATIEGAQRFYRVVPEAGPQEPERMPVYAVTGQGISESQAAVLAEHFGLSANGFGEAGYVQYTDGEQFQAIPTEMVQEGLEPGEDQRENIAAARLLLEEIEAMEVLEGDSALGLAEEAFAEAELLPAAPYQFDAEIRHSRFEAVDAEGEVLVDKAIDTQVAYEFRLDEHRVIGPGAQVKAVFNSEEQVTHLAYILRRLEKGDAVPILSQAEASAEAAAHYKGLAETSAKGDLQLESRLVYYAPPPELREVSLLIPHYVFEGVFIPQGTEQEVDLRRLLLPAVQLDTGLKPQAEFEANVEQDTVVAEASVEGGAEPYTFDWQSSTTAIEAGGDNAVQYQVGPVKESPTQETLTLTVTDANGIKTYVSETFEVETDRVVEPGSVAPQGVQPQVGGVKDAGTEWIGESQGLSGSSGNAGGFAARFASDAATTLRFNWGDFSAWEQDFKDPAHGGNDSAWMDNVDVAFYTGHANANGWTFPGNMDDGFLHYNEAGLGNRDLEWLTVAACGPLQPGSSPNRWWQRWDQAFQGLHLLCGYQTVTYDNTVEGRKWATKLLNGKPVRQAWMETGIEVQGPDEIVAVMGVFGEGGISNWNDHYHGMGPVGPDIHNIRGYWMVSSPGD